MQLRCSQNLSCDKITLELNEYQVKYSVGPGPRDSQPLTAVYV